MRPRLLFVYNADSGLFNTVTDIAHKLLSPSTYTCDLCALTHGHFKVRDKWVGFLQNLDADCEFLHRDEFHAKYGRTDIPLPAIFLNTGDSPAMFIDAHTLGQFGSLDALIAALTQRLDQAFPERQNTD